MLRKARHSGPYSGHMTRTLSFILDSLVRGYHVYQDVWNATPGKTLGCSRERDNEHDIFSVAVWKGTNIVGHVPRKVSCSCTLFIHSSGVINCFTTGPRQYCRDLPQRGLDIPCQYIFKGSKDIIKKTRGHLNEKAFAVTEENCTVDSLEPGTSLEINLKRTSTSMIISDLHVQRHQKLLMMRCG